MKKNKTITKIFIIILLAIIIFTLSIISMKQKENTIETSAENISNKKISWGIKRNNNHEQPDVGKDYQQILEENGTIIMIMNNKKKSLAKAKIIVNIDFPQELINQYIIYEQAIIVDCYGNITINKKRFNGLIIQNYDINIKDKNKYYLENEKYFTKELYEAEFYKKQPYENVREKIQKDGINISKLFGVNQTY